MKQTRIGRRKKRKKTKWHVPRHRSPACTAGPAQSRSHRRSSGRLCCGLAGARPSRSSWSPWSLEEACEHGLLEKSMALVNGRNRIQTRALDFLSKPKRTPMRASPSQRFSAPAWDTGCFWPTPRLLCFLSPVWILRKAPLPHQMGILAVWIGHLELRHGSPFTPCNQGLKSPSHQFMSQTKGPAP